MLSGSVRRFPGGGIIEIGICNRKNGESSLYNRGWVAETARSEHYRGITIRAIRTALGITALCRFRTAILCFARLLTAGFGRRRLRYRHSHTYRHNDQLREIDQHAKG